MQYVKTRSRATMKGEWYEVKVAALLYLRSLNSAHVVHFQIGTNLEGAGALDDIVHRAKYKEDPNKWYTSFIQLKHKEKATLAVSSFTGQKGDFSLKKYFDSFTEIKNAIQDKTCKNKLFFDGLFDYFQFVIYTNSKVNPYAFTSNPMKAGCLEDLLKSYSDNELVFKFNRHSNGGVFTFLEEAEKTLADAAEFLEKLAVFSGQPTESDLDDIIKKELLIACEGKVSDAGPVYRIFEGLFKQWWRDSNIVLDETSDILQKAIDQLSAEAELTKQTEHCTLDLNFDQTLWTSFNSGFSEGVSLLHVVTTGGSFRLSATKVLRLLQAERLSFTFVSLDYLLTHRQDLIHDWREGYKDCLVVVSDCDESGVQEQLACLSNDIKNILEIKPNKKAVIVSYHGCQLAVKLKGDTIFGNKTVDGTFHFTHLDQACRSRILNAKLLFQDHEITFQSLYDKDSKFWDSFLGDDLMENLVSQNIQRNSHELQKCIARTKQNIQIGKELLQIQPQYIHRRLKRRNVVSPDIFKTENCEEPLAVSGVTLQELKGLIGREENILLARHYLDAQNDKRGRKDSDSHSRILVLDKVNAVEEFNGLCRLETTVHWLHIEDGVLRWKRSKGNMPNVKQFIDKTQPSHISSEESVMASEYRVDLIIAEPGMGKSTLMPTLAQTTKNTNPADWIILINLRDHSELFNQSSQLGAFDFLTSALSLDSPLERAFLRVSLEQTGNITILLDSFDEISPRYEEEGCGLLSSILKTRVKKVVITSRHCMQHKLEDHLSTLAYNIIEFSEDDQRMFFYKFWSQSSTPMTQDQLIDFISQLMESVHAIDTGKHLMGIPLQTMMVAEVFHDYVLDPEHKKLPDKLDMLDLFEQFVERKFMILFRKGYSNLNKEKSRQKFVMDHMHAALMLLVHEDNIRQILSKKYIVNCEMFLKNIEEAIDNSGLVINVVHKQPIFLHQMFAEYLVAMWFAEHFHANIDFLKEYLFSSNYNVIRIMFDRILCKGHQLHEAILDMDMVRLETLLAVEGVDVNGRDLAGRSALHLAAAVGFEFQFKDTFGIESNKYKERKKVGPRPRHMVELLMEHGANVNLTDSFLNWSSLEYALKTETWDAMEYLLANQADSSNLRLTMSVKEDRNLLEGIFAYGLANILKLLLQQGLPVEFRINYQIPLLHLASQWGYVESVELLLSRGADKRERDSNANNPLHIATMYGHLSVVGALIENHSKTTFSIFKSTSIQSKVKYANINEKHLQRELIDSVNNDHKTAMMLASENGHADIVHYLISHGADVWSGDEHGGTCLFFARSVKVARVIIESLRDDKDNVCEYINTLDDEGASALAKASDWRRTKVVDFLISLGADVWSRDKWGRTCLFSVKSVEVARVIIESLGDDKDKVSEYINTLDYEGVSALAVALRLRRTEVVDFFIRHGADVWSRDKWKRTCLFFVKSVECARVIIDSLGDDKDKVSKYINTLDNEGVSALAEALKWERTEVVDFLISLGADVWARDEHGRTCLFSVKRVEAVRIIIESLGDDKDKVCKYINTLDHEGASALGEASDWRRTEVVDFLLSLGADVWSRDKWGRTCLFSGKSVKCARVIIESLGDDKDKVSKYINTLDNKGVSALANASFWERTEVVEFLISLGADVWSRDKQGRTCLFSVETVEVAQIIIESFGDDKDKVSQYKYINSLDNKGVSALAYASFWERTEVVDLLISHGADVWSRDKHHRTCLFSVKGVEAARIIIESLGDDKVNVSKYINTLDHVGVSALDEASKWRRTEVVNFLVSLGADVLSRDKQGGTS